MKSLERRFKEVEKKNPYWSTYICFAEAIKGQGFTPKVISRHFKLIDKGDYLPSYRKSIMKYLCSL